MLHRTRRRGDYQSPAPDFPLGRIVDETIRAIPDHYPGISVDQYIIMPDHVHLILALRHIGPDERQIAAPTPLSNVIQQMKRITSK